ncbi:hypothetical protein WJX82_007998 [Trebouxia sp. C0006]
MHIQRIGDEKKEAESDQLALARHTAGLLWLASPSCTGSTVIMGQMPHEYSSDNSSSSLAAMPRLKRCPSCSNWLPLHAFYTAGRSKTGQTRLHSHCKRCKLHREIECRAARSLKSEQGLSRAASLYSSAPSQLPPSLGHRNRVPQHESGTKLCTSCHCSKPLDRFYTAGRHKAGGVRYHSHCTSCKLGNEATLRMQPRKGSQEVELSEATPGLPAQFRAEQQPPATLLQQLQASRMPQQSFMGQMPALMNPQQLQGLLMLRQHPAMFSNPVLQSQQPSSAAAQSASTHQPSFPGPVPILNTSSPLSQECNSSGGSNDSGCMQNESGSTPKAGHSPSVDPQKPHFGRGNHRCADDSDSAVTWADRAGRGAEQTACTQSVSASHPEASGTQFCLHNSGQLSGRDVTSSHLPEAARWAPSHSPQQPPAPLQSPYAALQRKPSGSLRACGQHTTADAIQSAKAASNAAQQSLAATAAITQAAVLPRKGSSSLLADLRQAERQWSEAKQASVPVQQPSKLPEVKRSSRQAARAADLAQSPPQLEAEEPHKVLLQMHAQQHEAEPLPMSHSGLPLLRWGSRKRAQRAPRAEPQLFKAEPVVMASAAAVQAPAELAPAFIPRHSRKKGKVQRSAFE